MRLTILLISLLSSVCFVDAQNVIQLDTLSSSDKNIHVTELATDSNSTSYYIIIKKEVSPHIHQWHSESIFIIEGKAQMMMNDSTFQIKKGDFIYIPPQTKHAVKVSPKSPLKVLSIQAPKFEGKDRIFVD
tara:strand:- start:379 stop:771 length:393 start_codon:yes stop_codon:yes gene_type:complete